MRTVRIPLAVNAWFTVEGRLVPGTLEYKQRRFTIARILAVSRHHPPGVASVSPLEYEVLIDGQVRHIYYEAYTNSWFSVKRVEDG